MWIISSNHRGISNSWYVLLLGRASAYSIRMNHDGRYATFSFCWSSLFRKGKITILILNRILTTINQYEPYLTSTNHHDKWKWEIRDVSVHVSRNARDLVRHFEGHTGLPGESANVNGEFGCTQSDEAVTDSLQLIVDLPSKKWWTTMNKSWPKVGQ